MLTVADLLKVLNRIPAWGRLVTLPDKVEAMDRRIAELESQVFKGRNGSHQMCPKCRKHTLEFMHRKPHPIYGKIGVQEEHFTCSECGFSTKRHAS